MIHPYFLSRLRFSLLLVAVMLLTACGNNAERLRFTSELPDEFAIVTLRPLTLPPDYTLDAPTIQSESELSVNQLQDDIRASMLLEGKVKLEINGDDRAFLLAAKAGEREADIRRKLEQENLQAISEPLTIAEAIALEESFAGNVRTFFTVTTRKPNISEAK
ncbi:MAG: DUF3035 domain-containing protein [Alphaproteobacteria bacterium]|nr:DUF3035 domain-containing protein [Alphaproteobacteria bacterium]